MADVSGIAPAARPAPPLVGSGGHALPAPASPSTTTAPPPEASGSVPARPTSTQPAAAQTASTQPATPQPVPSKPPPAQGGTLVTVSESTVDIRSLPAPVTLAVRVVAVDTANQARLETALGRITVTANGLALEAGTSLRLVVDSGGSTRLMPASPQGQRAGIAIGASASAAGGAIPTLAAGDVVQARLLPAQTALGPANHATSHPGPTPASMGPTTVSVRILSVEPPSVHSLTGATPPVDGRAAPGQPTPGQPAPQPASLAMPGPVQGTVTGRAALGQPVLNFANGTLILDRGNLPDGARLQLEVLATARTATPPAPSIAQLAGILDEMMAGLMATPALAAALDARLPRMGSRLGSSTLFLLTALQGGGAVGLLGQEAHQTLQKNGRDALLKRLAEALAQRGPRHETDAAAGSEVWRAVYLPIATPQGWQPLRVAWRDPEDSGGEDGGDDRARFQIDFSFSKLGPIRLDGLAGTGRLDLLLISGSPLDAQTRAEIEGLFTDTTGAIGYKGHIRFVEQHDLTAPAVQAGQPHPDLTA